MNYGAVRRFFRDILGGLKDSLTSYSSVELIRRFLTENWGEVLKVNHASVLKLWEFVSLFVV